LRRKSIEWLWYRLPVRRATIVTTISEATRKQLLDLLGETTADIRVIPCCISPAFHSSPKEFDATEPTILAVGTGENKNLLRLADALQSVRCRLLIVGELLPAQREALARNGVQYENRQHLTEGEMVEAYVESDMLAFASTYEGFGMPILEAQAVERPVVTSSVASMPEVAGQGACLVNPFDVAAIRAGVVRVMGDAAYRQSLVVAGRRNCRRFSPLEIAEAYASVYREIAATHRSGEVV
jgi:glycosyltransferase involved in cell wall biosynthesis